MKKIIKRIIKIVFIVAVVIFFITLFARDNLPGKMKILDELYSETVQTETAKEPFETEKGGIKYKITPRFDYEQYGLVVADYDSENWLDFAHKYDFLNVKDICVVWGSNISNGVYEQMKFEHGEFTCFMELKRDADRFWYDKYSRLELANNHLLPATEEIYQKMKDTNVGDQVYLKGQLVDYSLEVTDESGAVRTSTRRTSVVRNDHSCEIIYVTEYDILAKGNALYRMAYSVSKIVILVSLVLLFFLMFI